jgi:hypothetical protein
MLRRITGNLGPCTLRAPFRCYLLFCACVLGLLVAPCRANAQSPAAEPEPDPRYRVEIIVFAQNSGDPFEEDFHHGSEAPQSMPLPSRLRLPAIELESLFDFGLPDPAVAPETAVPGDTLSPPGEPDADADTESTSRDLNTDPEPTDGLELIETFAEAAAFRSDALRSPVEPIPDAFRVLKQDELELDDVRRRMDGLRAYHVLSHTGWEQTGVDTDRSLPLDLRRLGITNPTGTIELYLRRFLHLAFNLTYRDGEGSFWSTAGGFGLEPFRYAESFTLVNERNAIRSGELHYIDHPMFGILVLIRPAPEPENLPAGRGGPAG